VALVGPASRNSYRYREAALREAAVLYDGKPVFLDHAPDPSRPRERRVRDLAGTLARTRFEHGRLRADVAAVDTEAGRTLLALAQHDRPGVGLSHVVLAERNADGSVVEKIHDVVSVDAVVFPATTTTFHEQLGGGHEPTVGDAERLPVGVGAPALPGLGTENVRPHAAPPTGRRPGNGLSAWSDWAGGLEARLAQLAVLVEELARRTLALVEERDQLRSAAQRRAAADRRRDRRARVEQLVEQAGLPRGALSDVFLDLVAECDDEARVAALVEDRCRLAEAGRRRLPASRERHGDPAGSADLEAALVAAIRGAA
ncbi:MAG: hypothetical protein ACOC46_04705, partial [Pirellulales bacterium]